MIRIGTAGWSLPRAVADRFPGEGRHLQRYAAVLPCVEINSSFHRPHRVQTYRRWADETPAGFRFAVKLPRAITHAAKLIDVEALLDRFVAEVGGLGVKLGVLLVQLPPSLSFDAPVACAFFASLRQRLEVPVACEPRHASWFTSDADALLAEWHVARVAADPAPASVAAQPGGWLGPDGDGARATVYYRWHGAPRTYWSAYDDAWLAARAAQVAARPSDGDAWCLFDNTAAGAALDDALRFDRMIVAALR